MSSNNNNNPNNLNIFKKNRILIEQLLKDTIEYTVATFKQGRTNFTVASAYGQIIFVTQNIAQLILYYIEDSITELNIRTATRANSVYGLASLAGHNPTRAISATGEISLTSINPGSATIAGGVVVIPNYTRITNQNNGLEYIFDLPSDDIRISPNGSSDGVTIKIIQGSIETQVFTGTGEPLQSFGSATQQTATVDNFFVNVYVNGEKWQYYDSLYDIPRNGKGYLVRTGIISGITIFFGNINFGLPPVLGSEIQVEYLVNSGQTGNLTLADGETALYQWVDTGYTIFGDEVDLTQTFSISNVNSPGFGSNPEPLALTRLIAPKTSRSMVLANPDNYIIFFEKFNMFSQIAAYTNATTSSTSTITDNNIIYIFLVPDITKTLQSNENYFTVEESRFTLSLAQQNQILQLISDSGSQIVTTAVSLVSPTISRFIINVALIILNGNSEVSIEQQVIQRLSSYFISIRRRDRIPRSDLITILEGISGVDSINLSIFSQNDETAYIAWQNLTPAQQLVIPAPTPVCIDEFGDILIQPEQLILIRGGWSDRNGIAYEPGISTDGNPCALNIIIKQSVPITYNTQYNASTITNLRG